MLPTNNSTFLANTTTLLPAMDMLRQYEKVMILRVCVKILIMATAACPQLLSGGPSFQHIFTQNKWQLVLNMQTFKKDKVMPTADNELITVYFANITELT